MIVMGESVPANTREWEQEFARLHKILSTRWQYRLQGRPCPSPLTNVREILTFLEQIEPLLQGKANRELTAQAVKVMEEVVTRHMELLSKLGGKPAKPTALQGKVLPETASEKQLLTLRNMRSWARSDAESQANTANQLQFAVPCGRECPYPDQCRLDPGGYPISASARRYQGNCLLYQLSLVVAAPGWKKLLGQRFDRADNPFVLQRIKRSYYYRRTHETCLDCIARPGSIFQKGCSYTEGRRCLIKQEEQDWVKEQESDWKGA